MPVATDHEAEILDEPIETPDGDAPEDDDGIAAEPSDEADDPSEEGAATQLSFAEKSRARLARIKWAPVLTYGVLPAFVLLLGLAACALKWENGTSRASVIANGESVEAARNSTVELLSYGPDTVEQDLTGARELLTGTFRDDYTKLINEVVIPGATEQRISAVASVPAAASVSASPGHAVVIVFVNQATTVGNGPPTSTTSTVRVTMDKVAQRWLIASFDPI